MKNKSVLLFLVSSILCNAPYVRSRDANAGIVIGSVGTGFLVASLFASDRSGHIGSERDWLSFFGAAGLVVASIPSAVGGIFLAADVPAVGWSFLVLDEEGGNSPDSLTAWIEKRYPEIESKSARERLAAEIYGKSLSAPEFKPGFRYVALGEENVRMQLLETGLSESDPAGFARIVDELK